MKNQIDFNLLGFYAGWRDGVCGCYFKGFVNPSHWTELQNSEFWTGYEEGYNKGKEDVISETARLI